MPVTISIIDMKFSPLNLGPVDALTRVLELLEGKDVAVKILLQLLVGIVDVELLKAVELKVFKAKNVQHANGVESVGTLQGNIELGHNPFEQLGIQGHRQRVARVGSLRRGGCCC